MARVYAYLIDDAPYPEGISLASAILNFGAKAVTGSDVLSGRVIRDCVMAKYAETVIQLYRAREASGNWAKWEEDHLNESKILAQAAKVYQEWQTR